MSLQQLTAPQASSALNVMLNAHRHEADRRNADRRKRTILDANKQAHARISVLEAENTLLRQQEERNKRITTKVKRKDRLGDRMVLSKNTLITREHAERELVAKKPAIAANQRKHREKKRRQEEVVVAPPPGAVLDGGEASDNHDKALLASTMTPPPPPMYTFLDELDDGEPLSAISDRDDDPFGFFEMLPQASPSRTKH